MSRLLRKDGAAAAASLGSFVLMRGEAAFRPRGSGPAPAPENDQGKPLTPEQEAQRASTAAHEQGFEEGRRAAELELAAERKAIARLAQSLEVLRPEPTNALALLLAEAVDRLVREIVGAVEVDATLLLARAKAAAALIGENVEPSRLRLHPEDAALIDSAQLEVEVQPDATLARGTIVLETGHGWIEDGPAVRLERLRAELDKMAAPK